MSEGDYQAVEQRLKATLPDFADSVELDADQLMRQARRQLGARDVLSFGFAHMLRTLVALFSGLYRHVEPPTQINKSKPTDERDY